MIRFTFLQSRNSLIVAAIGLVVVAAALAITGPSLVHLYDTILGNCAAQGDCSTAASTFLRNDRSLQIGLDALVEVVPGLIGLFWGAPLVAREFEVGTSRLVWTQSVTRARWFGMKLLFGLLASMVVTGLLSLAVTWWSSPVDRAKASLYATFEQRNLVPIGYAAFAFSLGVLIGVLFRRTIPAMATTLVAFVAIRLSFTHWVRPHLVSALSSNIKLNPATTGYGASGNILALPFGSPSSALEPATPNLPNSWINSIQIIDRSGSSISARYLKDVCPALGSWGGGGLTHGPAPASAQRELRDCVAKVGKVFHELVVYQPSSHYWSLQWTELAVYLGAALVLGGISLWMVARHTAS